MEPITERRMSFYPCGFGISVGNSNTTGNKNKLASLASSQLF